MRELARLLFEIRQIEPNVKNMLDALQPKYFDSLIVATKKVAKYNIEKRLISVTNLCNKRRYFAKAVVRYCFIYGTKTTK